MLRRLGVRGKILAVLAVPVLVLIVGAYFLVSEAVDRSRESSATNQVLEALPQQDAVTSALQVERAAAIEFASGVRDSEQAFLDAQEATDAAVTEFDRRAAGFDTEHLDERITEALAEAATLRADWKLDGFRSLITFEDRDQIPFLSTQYGLTIDGQLAVADIAAKVVSDRGLGQNLEAYVAVNRALDRVEFDGVLGEAFIRDHFAGRATELSRRNLAVAISTGDTALASAGEALSALPNSAAQMPKQFWQYSLTREALALATPVAVNVEARVAWAEQWVDEAQAIVPVRDEVRQSALDEAARSVTATDRQMYLTIGAVLLAIVASVAIALLISRRITVPLRHLTASAAEVRDRLPTIVDEMIVPGQTPSAQIEPIAVESSDEVGQLAEAFNEVNATTLSVARQQAALRGSIAEMFVNVARRDQVLLGRQLAFLDDLERSEEDPGTLANLFRLDHLATRMRRNAESLLVLAGIESGRRVRHPMPLSNVIRTASSEIELYDRVQLELDRDPMVLGHNALVAAHLLAELLENATVYSEPGTPVRVSVEEHPHWITVVVRDRGLGMSQEDIEIANEKASTFASSEIVGAQRLGLYVVGRLSHRLGARVRFSSVQDDGETGTEVRVSLPRALFLAESDVPLSEPTDPLDADTRAAAEAWVASTAEGPEASLPVDIESLTDGATTAGMPRRRSRTADPQAPAPSEALAAGATQEPLLPEHATPELPAAFVSEAEAWTPPATADAGPATLPSRARTASPAVESTEPPSATPAPVPARASMFTSFRARRELPELGAADEQPVVPEAEPAEPAEAAPVPVVSSRPEFVVPDLVPDDDYWSAPAVAAVAEPAAPEQVEAPGLEVEPVAPIADESSWPVLAEDVPATSTEPETFVTTGAHTAPVAVVPPPADHDEEPLRRRARHIRIEEEEAPELAPSEAAPEMPSQYAAPALEPNAAYLFEPEPDLPQEPSEQVVTREQVDLVETGVAEQVLAHEEVHEEVHEEPAQTLGQAAAVASIPTIDTTVPEFSDVLGLPKRSDGAEEATPRRGVFGMFRRRRGHGSRSAATSAAEPTTKPDFGRAFEPVAADHETGAYGDVVDAPAVAQTFEPEPMTDTGAAPGAFYPSPEAATGASALGFEPAPMPAVAAAFEPAPERFAPAAFFSSTRVAESEGHVDPVAQVEPNPERERDQAIAQMATAYVPEPTQAGWAPATAPPADGAGFGQAASRGPGSIDLETSARIALQAGIQEQALAELSRLSSYRPSQVAGGESGGLTRRVRSHVPDTTPADEGSQRISRDAAELRSRLSSFVSATSRGRQAAEDGSVPDPEIDNHLHPASDTAPQSR